MRFFASTLFAFVAACSASAALAQYGLYGAPNMLPVQQPNVAPNYAAPVATYPAQPAATYYPAQPVATYPAQPVTTYYPAQPAATYYPAQPVATYPAQAAATTTYQPYQPAAQYRYPTPNCQATAWAAPVEQPMAAPSPPPAGPVYQDNRPFQNNVPPQNFGMMNQQNSGMMNQMLAEQGGCCAGGCNDNGNCGQNIACNQGNDRLWYASLSVLVLGRSDGRRVWTSYQDGQETNQLTNTQFGMDWKWGGEVRLGRRFCCECVPYAIEATYWTTQLFSGSQSTTYPGGYVSTPLELNSLNFGAAPSENWFDGAKEHCLLRQDEVHNLEINVVREQLPWGCDSGWDIGWSAGVRYFRFQDFLQFSSLAHDGVNWDDLPCTAYLSDRITNNLIGAQFGFDAAYRVCNCFRVFISPKVGIYDNFMDSTFVATTGDGIVANGPYGVYPVHSTRNGVAFLTQIDVGADWQFAQNWSVRAGYRVVAMTGVGLADDQFPQYICDSPDIEDIQHTSSLVLHGAFVGLTYNF